MDILRTPDERFVGLADYPFEPHYQTIKDADGSAPRMHYLDEGRRDGKIVLLIHGEPSWSYLYRKFVPLLTAYGYRVIAPDLIGFGKSDKPASRLDYTYERHVAWMSDWLRALDLTDITLFCQDWGGLIGLRLVAAFPDRFARLVLSNTGLPVGTLSSPEFDAWLTFSQTAPEFTAGKIVDGATTRELTAAEIAAYDAPFPEERYKEGARQFPALVPMKPEQASVAENRAAWEILERFDKPVLTAFAEKDPASKGGERELINRIPGARGQPHCIIAGAGHFIQEDAPEELCALINALIRSDAKASA